MQGPGQRNRREILADDPGNDGQPADDADSAVDADGRGVVLCELGGNGCVALEIDTRNGVRAPVTAPSTVTDPVGFSPASISPEAEAAGATG